MMPFPRIDTTYSMWNKLSPDIEKQHTHVVTTEYFDFNIAKKFIKFFSPTYEKNPV